MLDGRRVWLVVVASLVWVGCRSSDAPAGPGAGVADGPAGGGAGDGGRGGAAATGGSGGGTSGACIDNSHTEPLWGPPRDLRVVGTGFEAKEGHTVRLVITIGEPRYGLAETTVKDGAFEFALPGAVGNYTGMGVYIDEGKDDACTLGVDLFWQRTTGGDNGPVRLEITPALGPAAGETPCNINGIFDLTKVLPCPS